MHTLPAVGVFARRALTQARKSVGGYLCFGRVKQDWMVNGHTMCVCLPKLAQPTRVWAGHLFSEGLNLVGCLWSGVANSSPPPPTKSRWSVLILCKVYGL